jgi:hypothetical protein
LKIRINTQNEFVDWWNVGTGYIVYRWVTCRNAVSQSWALFDKNGGHLKTKSIIGRQSKPKLFKKIGKYY